MITTVTCKSHVNDAAIVDGAAAAKAAAGKVGKHRDLVLAGNPDNRFVPFAVEEGGRLGTVCATNIIYLALRRAAVHWLPSGRLRAHRRSRRLHQSGGDNGAR